MEALSFNHIQFDVIPRNGEIWLQAAQIAQALGYKKVDAITQIYERNKDEFSDSMSETLKLRASGNLIKDVRIFSLRGAHLIAMFARTDIAKQFRQWVLDVLDHHVKGEGDNIASSTIGTSGMNCLSGLVAGKVKHLPTEQR